MAGEWDVMYCAQLKTSDDVPYFHTQPYLHLYELIQLASSNACNGQEVWNKLPMADRCRFAVSTREINHDGKPTLCIDLQGALRLIRTLPLEATDEHRERVCAFICKHFDYHPIQALAIGQPRDTAEGAVE